MARAAVAEKKGATKEVAPTPRRSGGIPKHFVPREIPIDLGKASSAIRENLCIPCKANGKSVKAVHEHLNACDDPIHIAYMRRITRWASRVAADATGIKQPKFKYRKIRSARTVVRKPTLERPIAKPQKPVKQKRHEVSWR